MGISPRPGVGSVTRSTKVALAGLAVWALLAVEGASLNGYLLWRWLLG